MCFGAGGVAATVSRKKAEISVGKFQLGELAVAQTSLAKT